MNRVVALTFLLTGCWKLDRTEIPEGLVAFAPAADPAAQGWTVTAIDIDLECPDGQDTRFYVVHPAAPDGPMPAAVLYHSGSFDFVSAPVATNPTAGDHLQDPPRLEAPWGIRMAFATLGMYPPPLSGEAHEGALPAALASNGVAVVVPVNCWGDWWHNAPGDADNDFDADFFSRQGRVTAEWGFRLLAEPAFGEALGIDLPFEPDPSQLYAIGLGEGSRAVGELLAIDDDGDGESDYQPRAIAVDSLIDDLSLLPEAQPATAAGLQRIFRGDWENGSLSAIGTLPPTAFVYSPVDAVVPDGANDAILARLEGDDQHLVIEGTAALHVLSNGDSEIAGQVVDFLLDAP
ncbi:MAG: hypothetical protein H6737_15685 [Alphaproteobacteria bacterium]|nr:hypothetical protein [Alphaproteobacteria bacterium]